MATVIKAQGPSRSRDGWPFNFSDLTSRAEQYLDQIRSQAADLLAQAEQEAAAIRRRAEEEGRQAARRAAEQVMVEKVGQALATLVPALRQSLAELEQARQAWLQHWEQSAVHLAAAIAAKVVRRELERDPQITAVLVREALELAAGSSEIRLHLHPEDRSALGSQVEQLVAELSRPGSAQVIADSAVSRGGCRLETRFGTIDQQFESQLARIEEELR